MRQESRHTLSIGTDSRTPGHAIARVVLALAASMFAAGTADASPFTPLAWQQPLESHGIQALAGQRKHTTWIRDQNRNFIDDEIERRYVSGELVDVIVDFNDCLSLKKIREILEPFGTISYVGKVITFVVVDDVRFDDLPALAKRPEVAMIELQQLGQIMNDVSTRAVQARASVTFSPNTAADAGFTGAGVNIAVLDTGVDDGHDQFSGKFVAGFNALIFEDTNLNGIDDSCEAAPLGNGVCTDPDDEPADGTNNPDDDQSHGSHVAGIALGQGAAGAVCSTVDDGSTPSNCAGVAPAAGLVDIKICNAFGGCPQADVAEALDWLALNAGAFGVRVANMSIGYCTDDDGTNAMSQQVNYLSSLGTVMVVALGNAANCGLVPGTVRTMFPGSSSFAVTVGGTDDRDTVARGDETNYNSFLRGPRSDFNVATPNLLALKPDIAAPGQNITSAQFNSTSSYFSQSGTSMAAPHVAGAAAVLLEAQPTMDPGSVKDLLKSTADTALNTAAFPAVDPNWDTDLGAGMLNVWPAVNAAATTDVGFPTCIGPPSSAGQPCALAGGLPSWNNTVDVDTTAAPQVGVANTITADVENTGAAPATVIVNFGVYVFGAGANQFFHIGSQQVTVPAGMTVTASQPWTPASSSHQCVQVSIDYGFDSDFDNNVTQRNLSVAPSVYRVRVENPFPVEAEFEVRAISQRDGWKCKVDAESFTLHPYRDCPRNVVVRFDAPNDARVGERANCDVGIFARRIDRDKKILVGGVTVQTFVPRPCRVIGWVRDAWGRPVQKARLTVLDRGEEVEAWSDEGGFVSLNVSPYRELVVAVETEAYGTARTRARFYCGAGTFEAVVSPERLEIVPHRREGDWYWDEQVRPDGKPYEQDCDEKVAPR